MKAQAWNYVLVCLVSVILVLLATVERGLWPWALLPTVVGGLGILMRWRMGSGLFLASLGAVIFAGEVRARIAGMAVTLPPFHPADVLICGAALGYVIGHLRLLSLTRNILPRDPRREEWFRMSVAQSGSSELLRSPRLERMQPKGGVAGEITRLLLALPICVVLGQLVWLWLRSRTTVLAIAADYWRLLVVILGCSLLLLTAHTIFVIWRYRTLSRTEAHMILQDAQWLDSRKEQRLISRWLSWAPWRRNRKGML